eukprot:TRINITY_DN6459_c0_g3_i2.p1 TRINITY_DN6459_c0_g3~~TRINITY_DN6459_c0_g3_i2.p1  ORF type:complete len:708 (+),score=124.96 TRINITY_DN6459_c0_g3_i2:1408-3531(+)
MFVGDAKALCPHLVIFPYNFKAYEEVADQFYSILHKYCNKVQAVSCDEAFLDVTDLEDQDPVHIASVIRQEICEATGCTASAGISRNMLMARLATKTAKPNGQCFIPSTKVYDYLNNLPIKALPGIGHVLAEKLKNRHIQTCGQLRTISKESLQKDFGTKTGDMLWNCCRGIDNRPVEVIQEMKSIGAEVNWGVRLNSSKDSQDFLLRLCKEVSLRLQGCGMQGRTITLKLKKRKKGAGEPKKYLGCGECENLSHSITVPTATDDEDVLQRVSKHLFGSFHIDVREVRGIGLQVSRLESADTTKQGREKEVLRSWIASTSPKIGEPVKTNCPTKGSSGGEVSLLDGRCQSILANHGNQHPDANPVRLRINENGSSQIESFIGKGCTDQTLTLPPVCNLDMEVLESLPPEILREINKMYCGKLNDFIKKRRGHDGETSTSFTLFPQEIQDSGKKNKGKQPLCSSPVHQYNIPTVPEINESMVREARSASVSSSGPLNLHLRSMDAKQNDLMPASLSQVDISVLQQLPEELKADVLELLPAHRTSECSTESSLDYKRKPPCGSGITTKNGTSVNGVDLTSKNYLWIGSPPKWVEKFKASNCLILSTFAGFYYKSFPSGILSSILQYAISSPLSLDLSSEVWDEAQCNFCELLQQYIDLKIESDIEEIYICFRLLERITRRSEFLLQVFDKVLPSLQAYVGEKYGGTLQL